MFGSMGQIGSTMVSVCGINMPINKELIVLVTV